MEIANFKSFRGKRVFVTGHTGFKGTWLILILNLLGAKTKGYSLAPDLVNHLYNLINGDQLCESVIADIRDKEKLTKAIAEFQPDYIFHLAAQPLVRLSYLSPTETFETNINGTVNLLEAARQMEKECHLVLITTDKVYENKNIANYRYSESDRLGGYDPYSSSKACSELVISSYRNSFFNPDIYDRHYKALAVARAGNVIGGGDWAKDRLVPDVFRALLRQDPVLLRNAQAIRPWQHVLEPLFGYLRLAERLTVDPKKYSQAYNFGPNPAGCLTVEELVKTILQHWGSGSYRIQQIDEGMYESHSLLLDIGKAETELDWVPIFDSNQTVALTTEWYKTCSADSSTVIYKMSEQINNYLKIYGSLISN